mgnify:CR=1 FL=1
MLNPPVAYLEVPEGEEAQANPEYQRFRERMGELITQASSTNELKIQAALALRQLNDHADRQLFMDLLEDEIRELRWIASERFRASLEEVDLEFLKYMLGLMLDSDVDLRSDAALLFNGTVQELVALSTDKIQMPGFFNPRASEVVRNAQQRTWDSWVDDFAPKLLAKAKDLQ